MQDACQLRATGFSGRNERSNSEEEIESENQKKTRRRIDIEIQQDKPSDIMSESE